MKPEFFEDEKVNAVSRDARYLTIGLITRADDRGRQQAYVPAILGYVYPTGDVPLKTLRRWLAEIISVGIVLDYVHEGCPYLWFPNFWRHQKINRPSESDLPPHPNDSLGSLLIAEAIEVWRSASKEYAVKDQGLVHEDSVNTHGGLTPSRAGARSAPFPSSSSTSSQGEEKIDAREREVFDAWVEATGRDTTRTQFDVKRQRCIRKALASHGLNACLAAVRNIGRDPWARGSNDRQKRFDDVKHALGDAERIERWRDWTPQKRPGSPASERKPWRAAGERLIAQQIGGAV